MQKQMPIFFNTAEYSNNILKKMESGGDSASESSKDRAFDMYPHKAMEMLKKRNRISEKADSADQVLRDLDTEMDKRYSKGADDDVLSLPDLTLPKRQSVNQDGNGFYEEGKATVVENSTLEDIDSIVDVLPLTMNAEPLVLTIDNAICSLDLSNTTKKYIGVHFSNYSFSSDMECTRRNQFIDKLLREREESVKQTEEYRDMVNSTLSDQTAVFANDHISIQHTRLIFKELRQKEKNITQELERRMRNQTCFSSVIDKYTQMKKELETTRVGLWNEVKATLQKEKEEAVTSKRIAPRFVSQGEVYNAYRSYLTDKRVKPSGTVSLLAGSTPGMHFPESRIYIRRMRMSKSDPLVKPLLAAGYQVVPAIGQEDTTVVVEMPIKLADGVRVQSEVSMFEQLSLAAFMQRYWADNQVSCTVTFDPETEGPHIAQMLQYFQYQLKGVSLFPKQDYGKFPQLPYEAISEEVYNEMVKDLKPLVFVDRSKKMAVKMSPKKSSPVKLTQKNRFMINLGKKDPIRRNLFAEEEKEDAGVGQMFPDAVSFCTNDHCQL